MSRLKIFFCATTALLLLIGASGCRSTKPAAVTPSVTTSSSATQEETGGTNQVGYTKPDSAMIRALLACDSTGNVYIAKIEALQAGLSVKPKVEVRDNYIYLQCKVDSAAVWTKWSRFHEVKSDTVQVVKYLPGTVTNKLNRFQQVMISAGIIACISLLIFILIKAIKPKLL